MVITRAQQNELAPAPRLPLVLARKLREGEQYRFHFNMTKCIGCRSCEVNPERGVVGKCDMCKDRLDDAKEPACVNACPQAAIEIEIVNMAQWRDNFAAADSPGMPAASQTLSTTRIALPETHGTRLERVDSGQIQREHAHMLLVSMTTLMQAVTGALWVLLLAGGLDSARLVVLMGTVGISLTLSTMHLGRPAFAWRAFKMWKRSWLSREVLLFTLFAGALSAAMAGTIAALHLPLPIALTPHTLLALDLSAVVFGVLGTIASARIYLVRARPAWNTRHTPIDFLLTAALLGTLLAAALGVLPIGNLAGLVLHNNAFREQPLHSTSWLCALNAGAWIINQLARVLRLRASEIFEARASFGLLWGRALRPRTVLSLAMVFLAGLVALAGLPIFAAFCGFAGVLLSRYLRVHRHPGRLSPYPHQRLRPPRPARRHLGRKGRHLHQLRTAHFQGQQDCRPPWPGPVRFRHFPRSCRTPRRARNALSRLDRRPRRLPGVPTRHRWPPLRLQSL